MTFFGFFFFVPWIVRPSCLWPLTITPSLYLPGSTLITAFLPESSTASWIVRYSQPCLQTTRGFFAKAAGAAAAIAASAISATPRKILGRIRLLP